MRAPAVAALALLAAASPSLAQNFTNTCEFFGQTLDEHGNPYTATYKCDRAGGKGYACAELPLRECVVVHPYTGWISTRGAFAQEDQVHTLQPYPYNCERCGWAHKMGVHLRCDCKSPWWEKNPESNIASIGGMLSNHDGTIVGLVPECRSQPVDC